MNNDFQTKNRDDSSTVDQVSVNNTASSDAAVNASFSSVSGDTSSPSQDDGAWSGSGGETGWSAPSEMESLNTNPNYTSDNLVSSDASGSSLVNNEQNSDLSKDVSNEFQIVSANLAGSDVFGPVNNAVESGEQLGQASALANESGQNSTNQDVVSPSFGASQNPKIDIVLNDQTINSEDVELSNKNEVSESPTLDDDLLANMSDSSDNQIAQSTTSLDDRRADDLLVTSMEDKISSNEENLKISNNDSVQSSSVLQQTSDSQSNKVAEQNSNDMLVPLPKPKKGHGLALFLLGMVLGAALLFSVYLFLFMDKCQIFNF